MGNLATIILSSITAVATIIIAIATVKAILLTPEIKVNRIKQTIKSLLTNELGIQLWLTMELTGFTPENVADILSTCSKSNKFKRKGWVKHIPLAIQELNEDRFDLLIAPQGTTQNAIQKYNETMILELYKIDPHKAKQLAEQYNVKIPPNLKK